MSAADSRTVEILLVEDDPADELLVQEALRNNSVPVDLNVVEDGDEALAYLHGQLPYVDAIRPDLILLDLKMPRVNGLDVLAQLKADPELRRIPVIVLSTSDAPEDITRAYDLQASAYLTKPQDLGEYRSVMDALKRFCVGVIRLPPHD